MGAALKNEFKLSLWQKKQAALLYHFSSLEYLKELKRKVFDLTNSGENLVSKSRHQNRDALLRSVRWGSRNTSENWANNAWQFLEDFKLSVLRDVSDRAFQKYHVTGAYQCWRGMSEYSMLWTTPQEQSDFEKKFDDIYKYARKIDQTMDRRRQENPWDDFDLALEWKKNSMFFKEIPKFQVSTDIDVLSGRMPPRTGVYVSADDLNATLQFAWTGSADGKLLDSSTFNNLGKKVLDSVGRSRLWVDDVAMFEFVKENINEPEFSSGIDPSELHVPELAPSLVARRAFCSRPSRWYFVEQSSSEFEYVENESMSVDHQTPRFVAGEVCQEPGFYFSPARVGSRRFFEAGEVFPSFDTNYGNTIWQRDKNKVE